MATDWDRIVREHGPMVYGTAWRILGNAADAEDVVQDVFLQIHQLQQRMKRDGRIYRSHYDTLMAWHSQYQGK